MDGIFSVAFLPKLLSEKFTSPMDALLNTPSQPLTPLEWAHLLALHDDPEAYVVLELEHYKERSLKDFQHEFLWIRARHRHQPADAPFPLIRVERTIRNNTLASRLGLWGPASDSFTVLDRNTPPPPDTECLQHIDWQLDQAPSLRRLTYLVRHVHRSMPCYYFFKASCYAFGRVIVDAIKIYANGTFNHRQPPFRFRASRLLGCFPTPTSRAHDVAQKAVLCLIDSLDGLTQFNRNPDRNPQPPLPHAAEQPPGSLAPSTAVLSMVSSHVASPPSALHYSVPTRAVSPDTEIST